MDNRFKRKATSSRIEAENAKKHIKDAHPSLLFDNKLSKRQEPQILQETNISHENLISQIWPQAFSPPQSTSSSNAIASTTTVARESFSRWIKIDDDISAEEIMPEIIDISDECGPPSLAEPPYTDL